MKNNSKKLKAFCISLFMLGIIALFILYKNTSVLVGSNKFKEYKFDVGSIGVTIIENGVSVQENLFKSLKLINEPFKIGKMYDEEIAIKNTGTEDIYIRAIINKSWSNSKGNKDESLNPELIELGFSNNDWIINESSRTSERIDLYYTNILKVNETSTNFINTIKGKLDITNSVIINETKREDNTAIITTKNKYGDCKINLEIGVDGIQTHNAKEAIKLEWEVDVTIDSNGRITSVQ